jgi:hypothetical protein
MFIVGPYEFTREDARNTLLAAPKVLTEMSEGRNGAIDHLLARYIYNTFLLMGKENLCI